MKLYKNIENGEVFTREQLIAEYANLVKENGATEEYYLYTSFERWLEECCGKNGSMREVKTLSAAECDELIEATSAFCRAFVRLADAIEIADEESINEYFPKDWPFSASLDDMYFIVESFRENVEANAHKLIRAE